MYMAELITSMSTVCWFNLFCKDFLKINLALSSLSSGFASKTLQAIQEVGRKKDIKAVPYVMFLIPTEIRWLTNFPIMQKEGHFFII